MRTLVAACCLASIVGACGDEATTPTTGADLAGTPVAGEPAGLSGITSAHNAARASAMPAPSPALGPLTWAEPLAQAAQSWADGCKFEHSGGEYGENLYASAGSTPTGPSVVKSWADEVADYDYGSNSCTKVCGHYTQVVWRDSKQLGCAMKACTTNSPFGSFASWTLVVCEYDPPGNFTGKKPY